MKKIILILFLCLAGCNHYSSTGPTPSPLIGDVNGDGIVDMTDVALIEVAYGSQEGDFNWNPSADVNKDGRVIGEDIFIIFENQT